MGEEEDSTSVSPIPCLRLRDSYLSPDEAEIDNVRACPNSEDNVLNYRDCLANQELSWLEGDDLMQVSGKRSRFGSLLVDQDGGKEDGSPADDEGGDGEEFWTANLETASLGSFQCRQIIGEVTAH